MIKKFNLQDAVDIPGRSVFLSGMVQECIEIKQYFKEDNKTFIMWFYPGKKAMGPPGHCHGGLTSALLDESMGSCCWLNGYLVMTAKMDIRYKNKIPIHNEYIATSGIKLVKGRRIIVAAEITDSSGKVYAAAEGTFLSIPPERLEIPPEYEEQAEKAAQFFRLRRKGLSLEDIFKKLGQFINHSN